MTSLIRRALGALGSAMMGGRAKRRNKHQAETKEAPNKKKSRYSVRLNVSDPYSGQVLQPCHFEFEARDVEDVKRQAYMAAGQHMKRISQGSSKDYKYDLIKVGLIEADGKVTDVTPTSNAKPRIRVKTVAAKTVKPETQKTTPKPALPPPSGFQCPIIDLCKISQDLPNPEQAKQLS